MFEAPEDWAVHRFGRAVGLWDCQEAVRARARRRAQGSWGQRVEDAGEQLRGSLEGAAVAGRAGGRGALRTWMKIEGN